MMSTRANLLSKNFCSARLLLLLTLANLATLSASSSTLNETAKHFHSISKEGVKFYRKHEYVDAIKMFEQAVGLAESAGLSPEQRANAYLNLCTCQSDNNDYKNAELTLKLAERIITENKVDNPALTIRLLRRQTRIEEHRYDFSGAAARQAELCKLYEQDIGRLVVSNFSEMARLQHLELRAKHYQRSITIGNELLSLISKFRVLPDADINIRVRLTQGTALILTGQKRLGYDQLSQVYEPAKESSPDLAAYAAAWLAYCAGTDKNETQRIYWMNRLAAVAEASQQSPKHWCDQVQHEINNAPH